MNVKKSGAEAVAEQEKMTIPLFNEYHLAADPYDPNSKAQFIPWSLELNRSEKPGFKVSHKDSSRKSFLVEDDTPMDFIFLIESTKTACACTRAEDQGPGKAPKNVPHCSTPDRDTYSWRGYKCSECPFKCPDGKSKPGFKRPLKKTAYFLVRRPETTEWLLVRYTSVLDNINAIVSLKDALRGKLRPHMQSPTTAAAYASVCAVSESTDNGFVGRFGKKIVDFKMLTEEDFGKVIALISEISKYEKDNLERSVARNKETYEKRQRGDFKDYDPNKSPAASPLAEDGAPDPDWGEEQDEMASALTAPAEVH